MTKIRLARFGSRHQPYYRIVVADSRSRRDGRFIEILGSYNPQAGTVQVKKDRAEYWISVGAQPSNTTISLLTKGGVEHSFQVRKKPFQKKEEAPVAEEVPTDTAEETAETAETSAEEAESSTESAEESQS